MKNPLEQIKFVCSRHDLYILKRATHRRCDAGPTGTLNLLQNIVSCSVDTFVDDKLVHYNLEPISMHLTEQNMLLDVPKWLATT